MVVAEFIIFFCGTIRRIQTLHDVYQSKPALLEMSLSLLGIYVGDSGEGLPCLRGRESDGILNDHRATGL